MAKKKNELIKSNEDESLILIAKGMKLIREGLLKQNLQMICEGYNIFTNTPIELPQKKKTQLEKIQDLVDSKGDDELLIEETNDELEQEEDVGNIVQTQKGKITIISGELDPMELKKNQILSKKKLNLPPIQRSSPPKDNSNDPNASFRYHDVNRPKLNK